MDDLKGFVADVAAVARAVTGDEEWAVGDHIGSVTVVTLNGPGGLRWIVRNQHPHHKKDGKIVVTLDVARDTVAGGMDVTREYWYDNVWWLTRKHPEVKIVVGATVRTSYLAGKILANLDEYYRFIDHVAGQLAELVADDARVAKQLEQLRDACGRWLDRGDRFDGGDDFRLIFEKPTYSGDVVVNGRLPIEAAVKVLATLRQHQDEQEGESSG